MNKKASNNFGKFAKKKSKAAVKEQFKQEKRKVIIDCDPGIDDSLAILLAINSPELEVLGLTITSGNVPAQLGAKNALKALQMCQRLDIPVYIGEELPLEKELVTAQDTHEKMVLEKTSMKM